MLLGCAMLLTGVVLAAHVASAPGFGPFRNGADQARYLVAARAWSMLDLTPARHHYLPLYPLLGAAFIWLTPWQPFLLPDLLCLLASLFIFVRIARRLTPGWGDAAPALCFTAAVLSGKWMIFWMWVVPWTTTGSAPLQFGAILLALRVGERPAPVRAFTLGVCVALIAGFRPTDAGVLAVSCGAYVGFALLQGRAGWRVCSDIIGWGALGVLAGLLPWLSAHIAIFGLSRGAYLEKVSAIGFEWRLLPLRWVLLVIDPRPMLPAGNGVAEVLPWVIPGVAGLFLGLVPRAGHRVGPAALVALTVALHWALYLTYRDLNVEGIWHFALLHYFKWTFPFLMLAAVQLAAALASRQTARILALAACVPALALFAWRPVRASSEPIRLTALQNASGTRSLGLSDSPARVDRAVFLDLAGSWQAIHDGRFVLHAGDTAFVSETGFKILPLESGALLMPLRPLPPGPAVLDLPAGIGLSTSADARVFTQAIVFGMPCGVFPRRSACW